MRSGSIRLVFDHFIHISNVVYLASYSVRDILWLRVLTIVGVLTLIPYYATRGADLSYAILWNLLFASINLYQIAVILQDRRPARLSEQEEALHQLALEGISRRQFAKLLKLGRWHHSETEAVLIKRGEKTQEVTLLGTGTVLVRVEDRTVSVLGPGSFLGDIDFFTDDSAVAEVKAAEGVTYLTWNKDELRKALAKDTHLREAFNTALSRSVALKLNHTSRATVTEFAS